MVFRDYSRRLDVPGLMPEGLVKTAMYLVNNMSLDGGAVRRSCIVDLGGITAVLCKEMRWQHIGRVVLFHDFEGCFDGIMLVVEVRSFW